MDTSNYKATKGTKSYWLDSRMLMNWGKKKNEMTTKAHWLNDKNRQGKRKNTGGLPLPIPT